MSDAWSPKAGDTLRGRIVEVNASTIVVQTNVLVDTREPSIARHLRATPPTVGAEVELKRLRDRQGGALYRARVTAPVRDAPAGATHPGTQSRGT